MHVFQDMSHGSSRCKPRDQNVGGAAIVARKRTSRVWEGERVDGSTDRRRFTARDHTRELKIEEEGEKAEDVAPAPALTRVVIRSITGSQRVSPVPVVVRHSSPAF
jgi:hypothetical protein